MSYIDLTDKIFGKLKVISRGERRFYPSGQRRREWLCECKCLNRISVDGQRLRTGGAKSCGKCPLDWQSQIYEDHLTNIRTPEAAYILGFIWADGSVIVISDNYKVIRISIHKDDGVVLKPILETIGKWTCCEPTRDNQLTFGCSDTNSVNFLINSDYKSKANSADKILSKIPNDLKHYFFRGLFDGDGCFCRVKCGNGYFKCCFDVSGPYEQDWSYVENLLKKLHIRYSIRRTINKQLKKNGDNTKSSRICIQNQEGIVKLGEYIYSGEWFGFDRKRQIYFLIKKQMELRNDHRGN